jgi:hypothetical protein
MEPAKKSRRAVVRRFIGEFTIIVLGVLTALGAESWVRYTLDRSVEKNYLERLLDDVHYDIEELEFVLGDHARSDSAAAWLYQLAVDEELTSVSPEELVPAILWAGGGRVPDLSRGTWEEALASGRVALIRDEDVLSALAAYDRVIRESQSTWQGNLDLPLWNAAMRAIASAVPKFVMRGCYETSFANRCTAELLPFESRRIRTLVSDDKFIGDLNQSRAFRGLGGAVIGQGVLPEARNLESALMKSLNLSE